MSPPSLPPARPAASLALVAVGVFLLFTIWSASFIAFETLLTSEGGPARFDWLGLTVARFVPTALLCLAYCVGFRARESWALLRRHGPRLLLCGLLAVPGYNFPLYAGQQARVAAPIASLVVALNPLFVMVLSAAFLGERITRRRLLGFSLAAGGLTLIALARDEGAGTLYPLWIGLVALAPLAWAVYTVLTKPLMAEVSPLLWTFLALVLGTLPLAPLLPVTGGPELAGLDAAGWWIMAYLVLLCTIVGFAAWSWLLRHLPATSVGFTVFLNPPMTTGYKALLAALFPATLTFALLWQEAAGGLLMLGGVAVALPAGRASSRRLNPAAPRRRARAPRDGSSRPT